MKSLFALVLSSFLVVSGARANGEIERQLQQVLDQFLVDNPTVPGIMVSIRSDKLGISWSGSAGVADRDTRQPIQPHQPLRLASTTKTYVAAGTLRLIEQGRLGIDDSLDQHLSREHLEMLRKDGYETSALTIRGLLTHTSGLNDHALGGNYIKAVEKNPQHHWTRREHMQFLVDDTDPLGNSGEIFKYSDTGYVVLGEVIERVTGKSLATAVRQLLKFDELGLDSTWWEILEGKPAESAPRVSQYMNDARISDWHASLDLYGGGGLVASVPDLAAFFKAMFEGKIYDDPSTLALMKTTVIPDQGGPGMVGQTAKSVVMYAMGLFASSYEGHTIFEHGGYWGTDGGYIPGLDTAFAFGITQSETWTVRYPLVHSLMDVVIAAQDDLE